FVVRETVYDDEKEKVGSDDVLDYGIVMKELGGLRIREKVDENEGSSTGTSQIIIGSSQPPPPPVPPPKPSGGNLSSRRTASGGSNAVRIGPSRRAAAWPLVSARNAQSDSRHFSPRSYREVSCPSLNVPSLQYSTMFQERERKFELEIRRVKGFELKRMLEDGNYLFRAVADQAYGDAEAYDLTRQMCINYMVKMVIIPATTEQMGVLPGHVATIAELKPGVLSVHDGNDVSKYFVSSGFAFIHTNSFADIVAVEAVPLDQIDVSQIQKRLVEFNQKLSSASTDLEKAEAQIGVDVHIALNFALLG
ncbi:hypothetical protein IFM89_025766, partial [Coptis chinensis]